MSVALGWPINMNLLKIKIFNSKNILQCLNFESDYSIPGKTNITITISHILGLWKPVCVVVRKCFLITDNYSIFLYITNYSKYNVLVMSSRSFKYLVDCINNVLSCRITLLQDLILCITVSTHRTALEVVITCNNDLHLRKDLNQMHTSEYHGGGEHHIIWDIK